MEAWRQELYHHGIKGMKWGIRRYQNSDGTLTDAGRKRYRGSEDYARAKILKRKGVNNLSNEELRELNERLQLERDYKKYTTKGESYTKKVMAEAGAKVLSTVAVSAIAYAGAKYISKKYDITPENIAKGMVDLTGRFATTLAKESVKAAGAAGTAAKESVKAAGTAAKESVKAAAKESVKAAGAAVKQGAKAVDNKLYEANDKLYGMGKDALKNILGEEGFNQLIRKAAEAKKKRKK